VVGTRPLDVDDALDQIRRVTGLWIELGIAFTSPPCDIKISGPGPSPNGGADGGYKVA